METLIPQEEADLCRALLPFRNPLCLTQYRLSRCLEEAMKCSTDVRSGGGVGTPKPTRVATSLLRRLGMLLQRATHLIQSIEETTPTKRATQKKKTTRGAKGDPTDSCDAVPVSGDGHVTPARLGGRNLHAHSPPSHGFSEMDDPHAASPNPLQPGENTSLRSGETAPEQREEPVTSEWVSEKPPLDFEDPTFTFYDAKLAEVLDKLLRDVVRGYAFLDQQLRAEGLSTSTRSPVNDGHQGRVVSSTGESQSSALLLPLTAVGAIAVPYDGNLNNSTGATGARSGESAQQPPHRITSGCEQSVFFIPQKNAIDTPSNAVVTRVLPPPGLEEEVFATAFPVSQDAFPIPSNGESATEVGSVVPGKKSEEGRMSSPQTGASPTSQKSNLGVVDTVLSSEEEAVMTEVQSLLSQMKHRAVQMNEWVRGEDRAALAENEALLSAGVQHGKENMKELSKLPDGGAGSSSPPPDLLARLPYGSIVWYQLLLPLWVVIRQVLLMLLVLLLTATTALLIIMRSRPAVSVRVGSVTEMGRNTEMVKNVYDDYGETFHSGSTSHPMHTPLSTSQSDHAAMGGKDGGAALTNDWGNPPPLSPASLTKGLTIPGGVCHYEMEMCFAYHILSLFYSFVEDSCLG